MDFEEYVSTRGRALERYAYVLSGDPHLAQDLTQTALAKAYRRWSWVSRAHQPDLYVRRIVTRSFLDWARLRRSAERPVADLPDRGSTAADPARLVVVRDQVRRGLSELSPHQRAVLVLRHYEGYDDAVIAEALGCSTATVRSHASRGLDRLKVFLDADEGETT